MLYRCRTVSTIPLVLSKMQTNDHTRMQLIKVLLHFAGGSQLQVVHLVQHNGVKSLCKAFVFFKAYDEVLVTVCIWVVLYLS